MKYINDLDDFEKLLTEGKLVVVDFTASWCGPCRMIAPKFEAMEKEYTNMTFVKVDVDKAAEVSEKYGVSAMPTFMFFKNGEKVGEVVGASESKLRDKLDELSS